MEPSPRALQVPGGRGKTQKRESPKRGRMGGRAKGKRGSKTARTARANYQSLRNGKPLFEQDVRDVPEQAENKQAWTVISTRGVVGGVPPAPVYL